MRRTVAALVLLVVVAARSGAAPGTFHGARYAARWDATGFDLTTPDGRALTRWPVGMSCLPADPDAPVRPSAIRPAAPTVAVEAGATVVRWHWSFAAPSQLAEQEETLSLRPDRAELQARVRWRAAPARLVRMVYGGRLAAGCCDLEGLWDAAPAMGPGADWRPLPVPGVTTRVGDTFMRKRIAAPGTSGRWRVMLGGVDDSDTTRWDGREIGRTEFSRAAESWTILRRYDFATTPEAATHELLVDVHNADGNGGIWRSPCVAGPAELLENGDGWTRATAVGQTLWHWCPDSYSHALTGRFTVSLTSRDRTRESVPDNTTSGGRFIIPPYAVAFEGGPAWWGIGTLDLPRAEDGLRVEWRDGGFICPFLLATDPATKAGGWTEGPRLGFFVARSRGEVLADYVRTIGPLPEPAWQPWWTGPLYCTWGDQVYGGTESRIPQERLDAWISALKADDLAAPIVTLDAAWWTLPKSAVEKLHADGRHVLFWNQPHWAPKSSDAYKAHPEWLIHEAPGRLFDWDAGNWLFDLTSAGARKHVADDFGSFVSAAGWHGDGIKMDFNYLPAPVWVAYADPAWGAGEQYSARVLQEVYRDIKQVRPDALVTASCANPLYGRVQDLCRLNDDWSRDPQVARRRAAVALAAGAKVDSDDWHAYATYLDAQAIERPVWGCFSLYSALYRGDDNNRPVPLTAAWKARLRSILRLASQATIAAGQKVAYDPDTGVALRTAPDGALVAAAFPLAGQPGPNRVLVVRQDAGHWLVTATASGRLSLPIDRPVSGVASVRPLDAAPTPCAFRAADGRIELDVKDAAEGVAYYVVTFQPKRD